MTILEVDPSERLIHAQGRDGASVQIALWEIAAAFRWPKVGEVWSVYYENNFPILGERIQGRTEKFLIESVGQGDVYLDSTKVFDAGGNILLAAASPAPSVIPPSLQYNTTLQQPFWGPQSSIAPGSVSAYQVSTNYTFQLRDTFAIIETTSATAVTLTVPNSASVFFPIETMIEVYQMGAGQVTIAAASGVTLLSRGNRYKTTGQNSTIGLRQRTLDAWVISGDLTS